MQEKKQKRSIIKENILYYLDYKSISKYMFYKKTGITRGVLDKLNGISEDNIAKFIAYCPEVNIQWLLTGKGNMLNDDSASKNTITESKVNEPVSILTKPPGYECALCVQKNITIDALQRLSLVQQKTIDLLNARVEEFEKNDSTDDGQKRKAV